MFSPDPSDNVPVQGSTRHRFIFVSMAIWSVYHHKFYQQEPLRQNLKDWRLNQDPDFASHVSQVSGRLGAWEVLVAASSLKGQANKLHKSTHCKNESGLVFSEVAECVRSTIYLDCPLFPQWSKLKSFAKEALRGSSCKTYANALNWAPNGTVNRY